MPVNSATLAEWVHLTNQMDPLRGRLPSNAEKMRYTRIRYEILRMHGEGVTAEDIAWVREQIRSLVCK